MYEPLSLRDFLKKRYGSDTRIQNNCSFSINGEHYYLTKNVLIAILMGKKPKTTATKLPSQREALTHFYTDTKSLYKRSCPYTLEDEEDYKEALLNTPAKTRATAELIKEHTMIMHEALYQTFPDNSCPKLIGDRFLIRDIGINAEVTLEKAKKVRRCHLEECKNYIPFEKEDNLPNYEYYNQYECATCDPVYDTVLPEDDGSGEPE